MWERAREAGISDRTLYRARGPLEVRIIRRFRDRRPVNYWLLRHQELPADAPHDPEIDAIDESLRRMAEEFPPANPLDEL